MNAFAAFSSLSICQRSKVKASNCMSIWNSAKCDRVPLDDTKQIIDGALCVFMGQPTEETALILHQCDSSNGILLPNSSTQLPEIPKHHNQQQFVVHSRGAAFGRRTHQSQSITLCSNDKQWISIWYLVQRKWCTAAEDRRGRTRKTVERRCSRKMVRGLRRWSEDRRFEWSMLELERYWYSRTRTVGGKVGEFRVRTYIWKHTVIRIE